MVVSVNEMLPLHRFEVVVGLSSNDEVGSNAFDVVKTFEVVVTSVEDVERVLFIWNDIHCFCIVYSCWRAFQIQGDRL